MKRLLTSPLAGCQTWKTITPQPMVKHTLIKIFITEHKQECQAIISLNDQEKPFPIKTNCKLGACGAPSVLSCPAESPSLSPCEPRSSHFTALVTLAQGDPPPASLHLGAASCLSLYQKVFPLSSQECTHKNICYFKCGCCSRHAAS